MDLTKFHQLDQDSRVAAVYMGGPDHFLHFRLEGSFRILLYDMGAFYAEVWYDAKANEVERVEGFDSRDLDRLGAYTDFISLGGL
jgi:hypothetical protein